MPWPTYSHHRTSSIRGAKRTVADDVLIDLHLLNDVRVEQRDGNIGLQPEPDAKLNGFCGARAAKRRYAAITRTRNRTIDCRRNLDRHPRLRRSSMSHFVDEFRVATYDPATGEPIIRTVSGVDELRAARCTHLAHSASSFPSASGLAQLPDRGTLVSSTTVLPTSWQRNATSHCSSSS